MANQTQTPTVTPASIFQTGLVDQKVDLGILETEESSYPCKELNPAPYRP